jgi:hypothetical protein
LIPEEYIGELLAISVISPKEARVPGLDDEDEKPERQL